jgi:hypothetical protein
MRHEKAQAKRDKKRMERDCHRNTLDSDFIAMENVNCIPNVVALHVNSTVLQALAIGFFLREVDQLFTSTLLQSDIGC